MAVFFEPGVAPDFNVFQALRNGRVIALTGIVFAVISNLGYILYTNSELSALKSELKDAYHFNDRLGLLFGIPGLNISGGIAEQMQKINEYAQTHLNCFDRISSIERMLQGVNVHSSKLWSQADERVKASMALVPVSDPLTLNNIEQSGMQISGYVESLHHCHSSKVQCENQTEFLKNNLCTLDLRSEQHHQETLAAKDQTQAVEKDMRVAKDNCTAQVADAREKGEKETAVERGRTSICDQNLSGTKKELADANLKSAVCQTELTNLNSTLITCVSPGFWRRLFCWI